MTEDELGLIVALWNTVRWWSIPVVVVMMGVRAWRHPRVQDAIPARLRWKSTPRWAQWGLIGAASLATSLATGIVSGLGWGAALWAALPVAVSAIWGHKATKLIGHTMHETALAVDPEYEPSPFRRAASILVPLNHKLTPLEPRR
jgi:hypothetical protein